MGACMSTPVADEPSSSTAIKSPPQATAAASQQAASVAPAPAPAAPPAPTAAQAVQAAQAQAVRQRQMQKRIAVAAEAITSASDVDIPTHPKTETARQLIETAISGNLLFQGMSLAARQAVIASMAPQLVTPGDVIIAQGDADASRFFVVERGEFEVLLAKEEWGPEPRKVATCAPGSGFGELALLYSAPRAATVRAVSSGRLWAMERAVYNAIRRAHTAQLAAARRELVDKVPLLAVLAPEHKAAVAEALELVELRDGEVVCRQGELGDKFYAIREGTVKVEVDGAQVAAISEGGFFGERALIRDEPRAATVAADGYVVCFALSRRAFNDLLGPIEDVWRYETLRRVPILANLTEGQLFALARRMRSVAFDPGEVVFRQGDPGDTFYVVEDGEFSVTDAAGAELAHCAKGQCFGELALLRREPRAATVAAATAARALACTREDFDAHLGSLAEIRNMWRFEALRKVPLLAGLTQAQRLALCTAFAPKTYAAGATVVAKGDPGDAFFIVEKGVCVVYGDAGKELNRMGPASYFGERALLRNEPRAATVKAGSDAVLLALGRQDFERLLGPLQQVLAQQAAEYDALVATVKIDKALRLADLRHVAVLGAGAFGRVTLVKYEGRCYALKALSKAHVISSGLSDHIKREKALQAEFASPFLVTLVASFKDERCLYMVMELVQGGEFFAHLQGREGTLSEEEARFYAGCVVLGLEYMHDRGVAWRDLKPENLLLDTAGYLKITDFGFAKRIPPGSRSHTLCGTPEYLAPELVTQAGHGRAVDWWAVGVLIYEMVAGTPPFHQEDRVAMFRAICATEYRMPEHFSKELKDLVKRLLVRVPNRRLGCTQGGAAEVKRHPWFAGFDWDALASRKMRAPFVPRVSSPEDASNFDGAGASPPRRDSRYVSTGVFKDF